MKSAMRESQLTIKNPICGLPLWGVVWGYTTILPATERGFKSHITTFMDVVMRELIRCLARRNKVVLNLGWSKNIKKISTIYHANYILIYIGCGNMFLPEKIYNSLPYIWMTMSISSLLFIGRLAIFGSFFFFATGLLVFLFRKMQLPLMLMTSAYMFSFMYIAARNFVWSRGH